MATTNIEEIQTVNAQGELLAKPDFTNPIAIKMDSAKKMSLADKTGNEALKREAAAEQSFADRMGGRSALVKPKQPKVEGDSQQTSPSQPRARNIGMPKSASQPVLAGDAKAPIGMLKSQSSMKVNFPQLPTTADVQVPLEAITLKLDAAAKQSLADRTGDIRLKQAAAAEQSLADRLGSAAASRLSLAAASRSVIAPTSPTSAAQPASAALPIHVPLPVPVAAPVARAPAVPLHTCSCCGHQEPFNGGGAPAMKKESRTESRADGNWRAAGTSDTGFARRKTMEKSSSVPAFANKPAATPSRSDAPGRWEKAPRKEESSAVADASKKNSTQRRSQNMKKTSQPASPVIAPSTTETSAVKMEKPAQIIAEASAGIPGM